MPRQASRTTTLSMTLIVRTAILACALWLWIAANPNALSAQQAGGVQASGPRVKVIRTVTGTKGAAKGSVFVMADPRNQFYVPDDRQVIVYFEWEAPVGNHHCEGTLRGPSGQLAVMSSFDYPATQTKFGGYWTIPLLENTSAGVWTFEARVDGESSGSISFEIISAKRPEDVGKEKEEAPPTPAELYALAQSASVIIEKLDARGQTFDRGSGFFLQDGQLVTAFRVIDAAYTLRITRSDGTSMQASEIVAWNRRQDWVVLKVDIGKSGRLKRGDSKAVTIGDHCNWLEAKREGGRVISGAQIVGKDTHGGWGDRWSLSGLVSSHANGGPLLNDRGEVIGLLGGALPESFVKPIVSYAQRNGSGADLYSVTGSAIPIGLVTVGPTSTLATLDALRSAGQFTEPVIANRRVSYGIIGEGKAQKGKNVVGQELKVDFTKQDDSITILVAFQGIESWKNTVHLVIYDVDNHRIFASEPKKISLESGATQKHIWSFPIAPLRPGTYRADALVGEEVAWRDYFRIRE